MLPGVVKPALETHLIHERDLAEGFGHVQLPGALARKYPAADKQWRWHYAFSSAKRSNDRRSGVVRRFHMSPRTPQWVFRKALRASTSTPRALRQLTPPAEDLSIRHR